MQPEGNTPEGYQVYRTWHQRLAVDYAVDRDGQKLERAPLIEGGPEISWFSIFRPATVWELTLVERGGEFYQLYDTICHNCTSGFHETLDDYSRDRRFALIHYVPDRSWSCTEFCNPRSETAVYRLIQ